MTQVFELHTIEGRRYIRSTRAEMLEACKKYVRSKLDKGYTYSSIIFCWAPVVIEELDTVLKRSL